MYGDRFIPRRYPTKSLSFNDFAFNKTNQTDKIDILDMKNITGYWRINNLKKSLSNSFEMKPDAPILVFHDWITERLCKQTLNKRPLLQIYEERYSNVQDLDWQCVPRLRPTAFADSTHDLPGFHHYSHLKIIAWSFSGKIAASFGRDLVLWVPHSEITIVYRLEGITALSYNATGDRLAVGIHKPNLDVIDLQVWNVQGTGIYITEFYQYEKEHLDMHVVEWDPKNEFIICGLSSGDIYIHHYPSLEVYQILKLHSSRVTDIKFSINRKYIATCDADGKVMVCSFRTFQPIIKFTSNNRCIVAWHPWKEEDLVIGSTIPARLRLINLTKKSVVAHYRRSDQKCIINALTFNALTAELVVSFTIKLSNGEITSEILVMASMNRVVDTLSAHERSVNFLMWNPNNTQLATAGDDETMNIWNFFAYSKEKYTQDEKKKKIKLMSDDKFSNKLSIEKGAFLLLR